MLENYIDQIITMGTLADSVTIIDDQQIIRHFQPFNPDIVPFTASDVVGTHFRSTFLDVDPADSGVLRALHGESTISRAYTHLLFNGQRSSGIESIFPIRMGDSIIGSISVSRFLSSPNRFLDVKDDPSVSPDLAEIPDMIGNSPAMQTLKRQILRVARTDANVLICGETGTGKELVAHAVHTASPRCKRLFYPQNCAAIPSSLLESTFFGSEKGAYTGSVHSKGILEQADGGTVFLDEINSLDPAVQGKILRALETKKLRRLGGTREIQSDFRIVSAMNEDPFACMRSGKIRNDLFFRLSTVILEVPPLRQRRDDIPLLAEYFLKKFFLSASNDGFSLFFPGNLGNDSAFHLEDSPAFQTPHGIRVAAGDKHLPSLDMVEQVILSGLVQFAHDVVQQDHRAFPQKAIQQGRFRQL